MTQQYIGRWRRCGLNYFSGQQVTYECFVKSNAPQWGAIHRSFSITEFWEQFYFSTSLPRGMVDYCFSVINSNDCRHSRKLVKYVLRHTERDFYFAKGSMWKTWSDMQIGFVVLCYGYNNVLDVNLNDFHRHSPADSMFTMYPESKPVRIRTKITLLESMQPL